MIKQHPDDLFVWPCGTWCFRCDDREYGIMSDDYEVIPAETARWYEFLEDET